MTTDYRDIQFRGTEWAVPTTPFYSLNIADTFGTDAAHPDRLLTSLGEIAFHPSSFFAIGKRTKGVWSVDSTHYNKGIFPLSTSLWRDNVSKIGSKNLKVVPGTPRYRGWKEKTLKIRFAIAIKVNGRIYLGPMSEAVSIGPRYQWQMDAYYGWHAKII
jgi:hypothetical protein